MEEALVLLGIAAIAAPVLLIIFMVWTVQLSNRLRGLEQVVERLSAQLAAFGAREGETKKAEAAPEPAAPAALPEAPPEAPEKPKPPVAAAAPGPWEGAKAEPEPAREAEPAAPPQAPAPTPEAPYTPPKAVVLRAEKMAALGAWLKANWIYVISAISLALAGLFFVQYGIETGLLSPAARVYAALAFGAALVIGGETVRRRWGESAEVATAYLPSVFSGAGVVTLFGAVLAALHLYALIGPGLAFAGLVAVAALAIVLGWYTGPLLAAIGILGAFTAPFLVGGESDTPQAFYGYFALVALTGLAIDAGRRWAWVSLLTLGLVYPAGWLLYLDAGYEEYFVLLLVGLVLAAMAIPPLRLILAHTGAAILESFTAGRPRGWPEFPTRLVAGTMAASLISLLFVSLDSMAGFWLALVALAVLFAAIAIWAVRAEALEDLALLPGFGLLALPVWQANAFGEVYDAFSSVPYAPEGTPVPNDPYIFAALAAGFTLIAAWRSWQGTRWPIAWAAGAAFISPAMAALLEVLWQASFVLGAYAWAIVAIALAGLMTALAIAFARIDSETRPRVAGFALAAIAMIAFALTLVLTETALTLALAVTTLAAAALDRRFGLRPLSVAVQVGAITLGWRLIFDPGLDWAFDAPYWELTLAYAGSIGALVATLALLRPLKRPIALTITESAIWTYSAVFVSLLLFRVIDDVTPGTGTETHWFMGLLSSVWLASAANQIWRMQISGWVRRLRLVLAAIYLTLGVGILLLGVTLFNPALEGGVDNLVRGPVVINTLIPAYLLPALVFGLIAWRFGFLGRRARMGYGAAAASLAALWIFLDIRHFWRGAGMDGPGFTQPELYTYTIALLLTGAGLLYQAIARRSSGLRKIAMAVIALTVAKVFLVDISGLVGLLRVFSFLALGLALAGLAFLNRWAAVHTGQGGGPAPDTAQEPENGGE